MYKYNIWARVNQYQTVNTIIFASNDIQAKQIAEAQFCVGNVLGYTQINE